MFGSSQKTAEPEVAGTDEEDISTNQEALPVPYIAGERKVAVRWLSEVYNQYTVEVEVDTGKKGSKKSGGQGSGTYDYFGSLAGAVCVGQTDQLVSIALDGKQVWALGDVYRESSTSPFVGMIAGYGEFHFYWGTDTQELSASSVLRPLNNEKGHEHPDYKGVSFIEFRDFLFGREKVTAPSVEIVVARRPVQSLITGTPSDLVDNQIMPLCAVAELMTNKRFGLGMSEDSFDAVSFQATAEYLDNTPDLVYCSPFLNDQTALREAVSQATTITDSFLTWDAATGKIKAGYWTHDGIADISSLPPIQEADLTETPDFDSSGWSDASTGWDVVFSDREKRYKESSEKYDDISLLALLGVPRRSTLNRSWITRREQALAHATEWGKTFSRPVLTGELVVRRRRAALIDVGGYFRLDIDVEPGGDSLLQVCRCISKSRDDNGPVTIEFVAETSLAPVAYSRPSDGATTDPDTFPIPNALAYVRPVEMPVSLQGTEYAVAVLAQRGDNTTVGFNVLYDKDEEGEYTNIGNQRRFSVRASLSGNFGSTIKGIDDAGYDPLVDVSPVLDISLSNDIDLSALPDDTGEIGAREDQFILILMNIEAGQIKLDADGFAEMEMFSVAAMTVETEGTRTLSVMRGRFSTKRRSFISGAEAWLVRKGALTLYSHNDFPGEAAAESPMYFKTEPFNIFQPRESTRDFIASGSSTAAINGRFSFIQAEDAYFNGDYSIRYVVVSGDGYWILFDTDGTTELYSVLSSDDIPPNTGWVDLVGTDTLEMTEFKETFYFPTARYFAPKITITTQPGSGIIGVPTAVIGTITDADGDLSFWSVSYRRSGSTQEIAVAGGPIEPTASLPFDVPLRFTDLPVSPATTITYDVIVRAKDATTFVDGYVEEIFQVSTSLATSVIAPPTDFDASNDTTNTPAMFKTIWLSWVNPADPEFAPFDKVEIFSSTTNNLATASLVITTSAQFASYSVDDEVAHYFWIRAKDRAGNLSTVTPGATAGVLGKAINEVEVTIPPNSITVTEIADDAISTPKLQANSITATKVGTNEIIANTANIKNGVITNAKIADLSADKLTAGTITAAEITLGVGDGTDTGIIKSASYNGTGAGWRIDGEGLADFADLIVRGDTVVQSAVTDLIRSSNFDPDDPSAGGWGITGAGIIHCSDILIYGKVPQPSLFIGGASVTGGYYINTTTFRVVAPVDSQDSPNLCDVYYSTNGTMPALIPGNLLSGNTLTIAASSLLVLVAVEPTTSRISEPLMCPVYILPPMAVGAELAQSTDVFIRTYLNTPYIFYSMSPNYEDSPADFSWTALPLSSYFRADTGIQDGFKAVVPSPDDFNPSDSTQDVAYFHSSSDVVGDRIGPYYRRYMTIFDEGISWTGSIGINSSGASNGWVTTTVSAMGGFVMGDDYPY